MRILVASKQHIWVFQELLADLTKTMVSVSWFEINFTVAHHVPDGVVLLVDGEYSRVGHLQLKCQIVQIIRYT